MSDKDETVATRLWRDRAQIREQERDDAQARLRIAEDRMATLMHEINQLTAENARLRTLLNPDAGRARSETERQMAELRGALMPLLVDPPLATH
jgi:predicted  nucleic acid-binding Zn-ribbon protein